MELCKSTIQQLSIYIALLVSNVLGSSLIGQQSYYCKVRLPEIVNSYSKTLLPVLNPSGSRLYFVRKEHPNNIGGISDPDDIWYTDRIQDNVWTPPVNAGKSINTNKSNALFSITADGNSAFIATVDDMGSLTFHMAELNDNEWIIGPAFAMRDFVMKSPQYFATMNADQNVMILAMNHDGSLGDLDLYVSFKSKKGGWSKPLWMGRDVNSQSREGSPFLAQDNKTLYFYSNGFGGYGGSDLFMTRRLDDSWQKWSQPLNLGPYINTPGNERSITLTARGDTACIISTDSTNDREGMYFVCLQPEVRPQEKTTLQIPEPKETIATTQSDITLELYFDTDKWGLTSSHIDQLKELCNQVKDKNKHLIIRGFTDDTGNNEYNEKLSLKRAKSVADHLKGCGMASSDVIGDGIRNVESSESLQKRRKLSRAVTVFMTIQQ